MLWSLHQRLCLNKKYIAREGRLYFKSDVLLHSNNSNSDNETSLFVLLKKEIMMPFIYHKLNCYLTEMQCYRNTTKGI